MYQVFPRSSTMDFPSLSFVKTAVSFFFGELVGEETDDDVDVDFGVEAERGVAFDLGDFKLEGGLLDGEPV